MELFLNAGMSPNTRGLSGETALMEAAHSGNKALVGLLLARGSDVSITDNEGVTALHRAAEGPFGYLCVKVLLDHGAGPNARTKSGETPIVKGRRLRYLCQTRRPSFSCQTTSTPSERSSNVEPMLTLLMATGLLR